MNISLENLAYVSQVLASIGTIALVIFAYFELKSFSEKFEANHENERKWRTTIACEKFDTDPIITNAARNIRKRRFIQEFEDLDVYNDCAIIFNYFEGIAVAVEHKLYLEEMVRDHFDDFLVTLYNDILVAEDKPTGLAPNNFPILERMVQRWSERRSYYGG